MPRSVWLCPLWLCGVLLVAGCRGNQSSDGDTSDGSIVLDRSIGGVSLWEERSSVEASLGDGITISSELDPSAEPEPIRAEVVSYGDDELRVYYVSSESRSPVVLLVETRSPEYRTADGIGVGSTLVEIRALPGTRCSGDDPIECQYGGTRLNVAGTNFLIAPDTGKVGRIVIAFAH